MDGDDYPSQDVSINIIQEFKYSLLQEVCDIEKNVRKVIILKDQEIGEKKIAFSAVAREISKLQEENVWKNNQLEDCYQAVLDKDKEIETLKDLNKEQKNMFERYEKKITKKHLEILKKKQNDNVLVNSENVNILFKNKRNLEEIEALQKVVNDKSDEIMLSNVYLERKTSEMAQENEIKFALKNSLVEADNDLKIMKDEHEDIVAKFKQEKEESQLSQIENQNMINKLSTNVETLTQESIRKQNYIDGLAIKLEIQSEKIENDKTRTEELDTLNHVLKEAEFERNENIIKAKNFEQMLKIPVTEKLEITKLYEELLCTQKKEKFEMLKYEEENIQLITKIENLTQECTAKQNNVTELESMLQNQADIIEYDFNFTREIDELKKLLGEAENESNRNIKKANDSEHMLKVQISHNIKYFTREIYELKYLLGEAENESNRNITKANVSENKLKFQLSQNIKYLTEISLLKNNVNEITKILEKRVIPART